MPRNAEVTRQWKLLRAIETSRTGLTLEALAGIGRVSTRTVRRDLAALQEAGFALYDDHNDEGRAIWRLEGRPFRWLQETSFTVAELAALYFSRTLLESAVDQPFRADLTAAFTRFEQALPARMRAFLERLPAVLSAKAGPARSGAGRERGDLVSRLVDATLAHRRATIVYFSLSNRRVKQYAIEPYRLAYGDGAMYLFAFVPEYGQMRTFAVGRIRELTVLEQTFNPVEQLPLDPFANSLGINTGRPEHVEIEFAERVATYVRERTWHASQVVTSQPDGSIVVSLEVCLDRPLVSWILGFGPFARVVSPPALAEQVLEELEEAREIYAPRLAFE